jgi:hypothetical protein
MEGFTMKYLLLIYEDERALNETMRQECYVESKQLVHELNQRCLGAAPLQPTSTAASVRVRDGKRYVTDGPFAETREQLGGFYLVDAKDRDEAIDIAARIPGARRGTIEVRPLIELEEIPIGRL